MDAMEFRDKIVVIFAAGCAEGRDLAGMAARAGARVIAVDHDAARANAVAKTAPDRIEALTLDVLRLAHCRLLSAEWGAEPLDLVIHCQALRAPDRAGAAAQAIPALTEGLAKGLARGRGRVVLLYRSVPPEAGAGPAALIHALEALPPLMQASAWAKGLRVTALRLPEFRGAGQTLRATVRALMAKDFPFAPGAVLPLAPDAPDTIDAGRSGVKPTRDD
jgi:NAD(P)-dependent dehydrogenase (short-subunit alcohol dehydrogenase family)